MLTRAGCELRDPAPAVAAAVRRELTVAPVSFQDTPPAKFRVYRETPTGFLVPTFWARDKGYVSHDARDPGEPMRPGAADFEGSLRADLDQPKAAAAAQESLDRTGGAILNMYAGQGKTTLALYVAARIGMRTLVLVHKDFLRVQWHERVQQYLPRASVTFVQGPEFDVSGDIVIASIQTILSRGYGADRFKGVHLVICDEAHHIAARAFSQAMFSVSAPLVMGLSATLTRKDGLTRLVPWLCGPVAFSAVRKGHSHVSVRVVNYSSPAFLLPPKLNRRGDLCYASLMTLLCGLVDRTDKIAREAAWLADTGRKVLVLSHRRSHAKDICGALERLGVDAKTYLGGDKQAPDCRVTVATYALVSEGYDDASLSGLVLATPSSDIVQAVGRVMRGGDFSDPVIVDIVDKYSVCYAQFAKRRRYYTATGFTFLDDGGTRTESIDGSGALHEFAFIDED